MIKIYTDTTLLTQSTRRIIFPLLLDLFYINTQELLEKYSLVETMNDADIVILPLDVGYFYKTDKVNWMENFIDAALGSNKKVWLYTENDFGMTVNKNVYTFRMGGMNSKLNKKTFILPSFIQDPYVKLQKNYSSISKHEKPQIGFVGNANGSIIKWIKEVLIYFYINAKRLIKIEFNDYQSFYPSSTKRFHFLSTLKKNNKIETDFIFRKKYRAGAKTEQEKEKTTIDFLNNVYGNPYTFCVRGGGNFSVRFYETIAMGRIPLIIDTDIRLPLDSFIKWENHCVIANKDNFTQVLIDFHNNISKDDFKKMQDNNRNLWINHLRRQPYFLNLHSIFNNIK